MPMKSDQRRFVDSASRQKIRFPELRRSTGSQFQEFNVREGETEREREEISNAERRVSVHK